MQLERFPTTVRRTLVSLFGERPDVVRSRTDAEQQFLRAVRVSKIVLVENYFGSRDMHYATLETMWGHPFPFCLFLRSFTMGHRQEQSASSDEESIWQDGCRLRLEEPAGGRLLPHLLEVLSFQMAVVAVANPHEFLRIPAVGGWFVNLVLDESVWHRTVQSLIRAASFIVVHRAESSPGVDQELDAIWAAGRAPSTLVVREPQVGIIAEPDVDPRLPQNLIPPPEPRRRAREASSTDEAVFPPDPQVDRFRVLKWRSDEGLSGELLQAIGSIIPAYSDREWGPLPALEPPRAPDGEREQFLEYARQGYDGAAECVKKGELRLAEELLFESFASSCVSEDQLAKASAALGLGRLLLLDCKDATSAEPPLGIAATYFGLADVRDYAIESLNLFAAAAALLGKSGEAIEALRAAGKFERSPDDRAWQRNLWLEIKARATDSSCASLADSVISEL